MIDYELPLVENVPKITQNSRTEFDRFTVDCSMPYFLH